MVQSAEQSTNSIDAFKAYLDCDQAYHTGRYGEALASYKRAVSLDSTFALAYYRMARAADWSADGSTLDTAVRQSRRLSFRLPERERLIVTAGDAWERGEIGESARLLLRTLELYQNDPEATYEFAEVLFHTGFAIGRSSTEARAPFESVVAQEPDNVEALAHLARLDVRAG